MISRVASKRNAQLVVVLLCAAAVKLYYSTASVNQLRWILAPTAFVVELVSGSRFEFESHAGYINDERSFVIAASCAGVNFLITSFLMLSLRKLWGGQVRDAAWGFIPCAALCAYLATLVANAVRISAALRLHGTPHGTGWLSQNQLHRFEGIFIYFGFLLLLFMVVEKMGSDSAPSPENASGLPRRLFFPLLIYYATTLGIPLANGAYRQGADFREHTLFVLLTPLLLILPLAAFRFYRVMQRPDKDLKTHYGATGGTAGRGIFVGDDKRRVPDTRGLINWTARFMAKRLWRERQFKFKLIHTHGKHETDYRRTVPAARPCGPGGRAGD